MFDNKATHSKFLAELLLGWLLYAHLVRKIRRRRPNVELDCVFTQANGGAPREGCELMWFAYKSAQGNLPAWPVNCMKRRYPFAPTLPMPTA